MRRQSASGEAGTQSAVHKREENHGRWSGIVMVSERNIDGHDQTLLNLLTRQIGRSLDKADEFLNCLSICQSVVWLNCGGKGRYARMKVDCLVTKRVSLEPSLEESTRKRTHIDALSSPHHLPFPHLSHPALPPPPLLQPLPTRPNPQPSKQTMIRPQVPKPDRPVGRECAMLAYGDPAREGLARGEDARGGRVGVVEGEPGRRT